MTSPDERAVAQDAGRAVIRFYRSSERPYGVFSNLFRRQMEFEGRRFETAEHAYQFGKPRKDAVREWMMSAPSPALLAMAAHGLYHWDIAPGWSRGRRLRMRAVVLAKFSQHPDLAHILDSTGDALLIETASVDNDVNRRWGQVLVNGHYVGQNWLGETLMDIRAALRECSRSAQTDQALRAPVVTESI